MAGWSAARIISLSMLGTVETTSADFNQIRALIAGDLDYFMGFHFVQTTELTKSARIRNCFAYAEGESICITFFSCVRVAPRVCRPITPISLFTVGSLSAVNTTCSQSPRTRAW
jgi:hypothetical protein